jgi:hypothetical protein
MQHTSTNLRIVLYSTVLCYIALYIHTESIFSTTPHTSVLKSQNFEHLYFEHNKEPEAIRIGCLS